MKKVLGAVLIVLVAVSFAHAEVDKPLHVYLQGGATLPTGDLKDGFKTGFNAGGGVGFSINENIEIVGRVLYHSLKPDVEGDLDGGEFTPLMYGGEIKLNTGQEDTNFYLIGGYGIVKVKFKEAKYNGSVFSQEYDESENYFCFGAGVDFGSFFIEGRYVSIKMDDYGSGDSTIKMIPICAGIKF